jgi:hypothetical protein
MLLKILSINHKEKNNMCGTIKKLAVSCGLVLSAQLLFTNAVLAHEPRAAAGGAVNIAVGWRSEPALVDQLNQFDFIVTDDIEVTDLDLSVTIMYLKEDAQDAKVLSSSVLTGALTPDRDNPNRFNIYVLPTKVGAYGFHIEGMLNGIMIDEVFICRGGTQNTDGRSFGCIEEVQKFPTHHKSKHQHDDD